MGVLSDDGHFRDVGLGPGTMIQTPDGEEPVEWLEPGVGVITRDHGIQVVRSVLRTRAQTDRLIVFPAPPERQLNGGNDLRLGPSHRVLERSAVAQLHFFSSEVLVHAAHVPGLSDASLHAFTGSKSLTHLVFDHHELVLAEGRWVESFQCCPDCLAWLAPEEQERLTAAFGGHVPDQESARASLTFHEAALVCQPPAMGLPAARKTA